MKNSLSIVKYLPYTILAISISSVSQWTLLPIGNTFFWWVIYAIILYLFFKGRIYFHNNTDNILPVNIFLSIVGISLIHGVFKSEFYWDWKLLIQNLMVYLLPVSVFIFSNPIVVAKIIKVWLRYALIAFLLLFIIFEPEAYGRYLVPLSILLLFFPILPTKWKLIGLASVLLVSIVSIDSRSNIIKFIVPILISTAFYTRNLFSKFAFKNIFRFTSIILLISPFIFFILAATNIFNIFNVSEYIKNPSDFFERENKQDNYTYSLLDDTRTFIYEEVIYSAISNNYVIFGRSMARGYDTTAFAGAYKEVQEDTNRNERADCEVSIMNIFNYFGIVGVISYFLIFITASYNAIAKSNNTFMLLIGLYISFRWVYSWVEDYNRFDLNYLFLWLLIGMCFSTKFRSMNNNEFVRWFKLIFN